MRNFTHHDAVVIYRRHRGGWAGCTQGSATADLLLMLLRQAHAAVKMTAVAVVPMHDAGPCTWGYWSVDGSYDHNPLWCGAEDALRWSNAEACTVTRLAAVVLVHAMMHQGLDQPQTQARWDFQYGTLSREY